MLRCTFCGDVMRACSPVGSDPAFRCRACNVRITVTNQSYLPVTVKTLYWALVKQQKLMRQEDMVIEPPKRP